MVNTIKEVKEDGEENKIVESITEEEKNDEVERKVDLKDISKSLSDGEEPDIRICNFSRMDKFGSLCKILTGDTKKGKNKRRKKKKVKVDLEDNKESDDKIECEINEDTEINKINQMEEIENKVLYQQISEEDEELSAYDLKEDEKLRLLGESRKTQLKQTNEVNEMEELEQNNVSNKIEDKVEIIEEKIHIIENEVEESNKEVIKVDDESLRICVGKTIGENKCEETATIKVEVGMKEVGIQTENIEDYQEHDKVEFWKNIKQDNTKNEDKNIFSVGGKGLLGNCKYKNLGNRKMKRKLMLLFTGPYRIRSYVESRMLK